MKTLKGDIKMNTIKGAPQMRHLKETLKETLKGETKRETFQKGDMKKDTVQGDTKIRQ